MQQNIYVFGHKNPDTDSICSAIAYTYLKNKLGLENVKAVRLGEVNKETKYALDYFNVETPILLNKLKIQVKDLYIRPIECVNNHTSIMKAVDITVHKNKHLTPVVDDKKRLTGIITLSNLYPALIGEVGTRHLKETKTPFKNILEVLDNKNVYGEYPFKYVEGKVSMLSEVKKNNQLNKGDIIILGDSVDNRYAAFNSGASCIIISVEEKNRVDIKIPKSFDGVVITVESSVFDIVKCISKTVPVESMVNSKMLEYFELTDCLDEVKEQIIASKHSNFPVVNEDGEVMGVLSRSDLLKVNRNKVILVDHNEYTQSIKGIEDAEILEVIDHHRIANIQTMSPLYYRAEPVGCTSTIIAKLFKENNIDIPKHIAGIMLSAIISDTLLFNSPTCTDIDKIIAEELAKIANVNINEYGTDMLIAGTSIEDETPEHLIMKDMKKFTFGKYKAVISQINTGDVKKLSNMLPLLKEKIEHYCIEQQLDMAVLMVTNIIFGGSEIIIAGKNKWIAQNAFNIEPNEDTIYLKGVFSRKKQIVPALMNAAQLD